jgi:putative oxidoreductase
MDTDLQLVLFRLCAGLAFMPHALPKLFEGLEVRTRVAQQFAQLGIAHSLGMVMITGAIELVLCVGLTIGFGTQAAGLVSALYLAITIVVGHYPEGLFGGGWEYRALWMLACAGLAIAGGGRWSLDAWLKDA